VILFVKIGQGKKENNQAFVKNAIIHPKAGDIFQITYTDGTNADYTYYKVARSTRDSIYLNPGKTHLKSTEQWDKIPIGSDAYEASSVGFSIKQSQDSDMFTFPTNPPHYGMVWSLYRDGKLYKKY